MQARTKLQATVNQTQRQSCALVVLCPLVFWSNESDLHLPLTVLHLPTFLPSSRQGFEFRRVLTLHVFNHSMRQQAVQRFLSRLLV